MIATFYCQCCKRTVTEEHDEDIALAEAERDFPGHFIEEKLVMVCRSCYDLIKDSLKIKPETSQ